jgi:hypothetical protein
MNNYAKKDKLASEISPRRLAYFGLDKVETSSTEPNLMANMFLDLFRKYQAVAKMFFLTKYDSFRLKLFSRRREFLPSRPL